MHIALLKHKIEKEGLLFLNLPPFYLVVPPPLPTLVFFAYERSFRYLYIGRYKT